MTAFLNWWADLPIMIDPYIATVGPVKLHWYGFMYVVAFAVGYLLIARRITRGEIDLTLGALQDFMTWAVLGVVIGGRLGYALFYAPLHFLTHPLQLIFPFSGGQFVGIAGMSFHGGLVGIAMATLLFARRRGISFWQLADAAVPAGALAFMFGRIGNFLNGELWGRETTVPWAMRFPRSGDLHLRHPSQLYEAFGEGLLLFAILWPLRNHPKLRGHFLGLYIIGYAVVRFMIEFVREPDRHLGTVLGPLTMGQTLSLLTLIGGILVLMRHNLRTMFWDKWFKKGSSTESKDEAAKPEMKEEAPSSEAAPAPESSEKPEDDHSHDSDEDKKICKFC